MSSAKLDSATETKELLKYLLLGLLAAFIILFLYLKTQSINPIQHNQFRENSSLFRQTDAILNQHILEIRQGLITNYDLTVQGINKLNQLTTKIQTLLNEINIAPSTLDNKKLNQAIEHIYQALKQKQNLLEAFKSKNAILRNSLLYLPTATSQLSKLLSTNKSQQKLKTSLNSLLRNTLIFVMANDSALTHTVNDSIKQLGEDFKQTAPQLNDNIQNILMHIKIILANKDKVNFLTQKILNLPTTHSINVLQASYEKHYDERLKITNRYRQSLVALSIILLAAIIYILFRLNHTRNRLRRTVNDLNYQKFAMDQHAIVSITDKFGAITYANQKFCEISQRSVDELIGQNHRISKSGYHSSSFYKNLWNTISQGNVWHGQILNYDKHKNPYWVDTTIVPFMDTNNEPYQYVAIRTDITELKKTEEHLLIHATALETAANGILITDCDGIILWANHATTEITGYSQKELLNKKTNIFKSNKHDTAFYDNIWKTILTGKVWHGEISNQHKDGHIYIEEQTISPVHDDQGNIIRFIAIKQDISERKLQDEKLRHSQKMDALGELTGGIAHDYNNMLGVILGYAELLKDMLRDKDKSLENYAEEILHAADRGAKLTGKLLAFSKHHSSDAIQVNINSLLKDNRDMLEKTLTARIQLKLDLPEEEWLTYLDHGDLEDAILNICINAMHAIDGHGQITIKLTNTTINSKDAHQLELKAADYVILSIIDTGCGMDDATKEKIFDPFYSTKGEKGTGLGLSQVYGFVERSGGAIKVYSEIGHGTQIVMYFPCYSPKNTQQQQQISKGEEFSGNETILIVDDEPALLNLASEILRSQGYRVLSATRAQQALEIMKKEYVDLLLSDIIMPEMDGDELALQVKEKYPQVKIQLASGYSSNQEHSSENIELHKNLLQKPYKAQTLLSQIRKLLNE